MLLLVLFQYLHLNYFIWMTANEKKKTFFFDSFQIQNSFHIFFGLFVNFLFFSMGVFSNRTNGVIFSGPIYRKVFMGFFYFSFFNWMMMTTITPFFSSHGYDVCVCVFAQAMFVPGTLIKCFTTTTTTTMYAVQIFLLGYIMNFPKKK